jgi:ABC-type polysaccharide/polyol phosphate transport system ATPase subunit
MKKEAAITVKDLRISYRGLKKFSIKRSFFKGGKNAKEVFEAVKGISFEVEKGKILGLIGKNGSGKSTTLRALSGIFSPDSGEIDLHGNTISLLSIGVGFQTKLTGYENIYLSGMLLGFSEKQIREKEKEIIEFADIGDFIYKPVKTYSSGMHSKLAFAITAILETDIMLIDEVLSVGDATFKEKSYNKMKELINDENRTVVIVSHSLDTIRNLCDEVLWLHNGEIKKIGEPDSVIEEYKEFMQIK